MSPIVAWALAGSPALAADKARTVEVEGSAPIVDAELVAAREHAMEDARLRAVETVRGVEIEATTTIANELLAGSSVASHSLGWVSAAEILKEGPADDGLYHVRARLTVEPPTSAPLAPGQRAAVVVDGDGGVREPLRNAMTARLAAAGIVAAADGERGVRVSVELSVAEEIRPQFFSHRIRAAALVDGRAAGTVAEAKEFGVTAEAAVGAAVGKAADRLVADLLAHSVSGYERRVRVTVDGIADLAAYDRMAARLRSLGGVAGVNEDRVGLKNGRGVWTLLSRRPGGEVAVQLDRERDVEIVSFDPDRVDARVDGR